MIKIFAGNDPEFLFWTPDPDEVVLIGPEQRQIPLPQLPIPIHAAALAEGVRPSDDAIGTSIYDYLRQYPDVEGGRYLAALLRDAYPHFLADLAAQVVMLDEKEVDAAYVRRKLTGLKILGLLDPQPQLLTLLGQTALELGLMFSELAACRSHFRIAAGYLQQSLAMQPHNPAALTQLAQIEYWFGDNAQAIQHWRAAAAQLPSGPTQQTLLERAATCVAQPAPLRPLIDDLEALGATLPMIGNGEFYDALAILEELEAEGRVVREIPMPEFHYLLGYCREKAGQSDGALIAYQQSLALDPEHQPAQEGFERISGS